MVDTTAEADDQHLSALLWIATGRLIAIGSAAVVLALRWWNKGTPEKFGIFIKSRRKEQSKRLMKRQACSAVRRVVAQVFTGSLAAVRKVLLMREKELL